MKSLLAHWLTEHRHTLLPRWIASLSSALYPVPHGVDDDPAPPPDPVIVTHPDEQRILLTAIYDGLVAAADEHYEQIDECLQMLRALRTTPGEDELPLQMTQIFQLRRTAWELIVDRDRVTATNGSYSPFELADALDRLIEYVSVTSAQRWVSAASKVSRELNETRMLVESLYREAEATDRVTMHVSNLNQITQGLTSSLDRYEQITIAGEGLIATLGVHVLTIWLLDDDGVTLREARSWDTFATGVSAEHGWTVSVHADADLVAAAFRADKLVLEAQPNADQQGAWYRAPHAVLAAPLVVQHRVIGVITIQDDRLALLNDRSEQDFLLSVASQTAVALENTRLIAEIRSLNQDLERRIAERTRELQVERDTLETINTIALDISSTLDENLLMQNALVSLSTLVGVTHGSIMLRDRETDQLISSAVLGRDEIGDTRFPVGQGIVGWVAQSRKSALVPDVRKDHRWVEPPNGSDDPPQHKTSGAMLAVPLVAHHEIQGVIVLSHTEIGYFNKDHLRLLEAVAHPLAVGIHNALLYRQVEQDLLRRYEMQRIQEEAASLSNAILQSLSDGVVVCEKFGSVITVNPAAERILERPVEELLIWNMPELIKRLLGNRTKEIPVEDLLEHPLDSRGQIRMYTSVFHIGTHTINVTLTPVLSTEKQTPMGALAVFRDITREVESDRLKTEFIGTVSHELRTPMTSIKGYTQLLAMGSLGAINDTQREFLKTIQNNTERMISIINDLLDITKVETGSVELDLRPLNVAEVLSMVVLDLQPRIQERGHDVAISLSPGLVPVRADERRLNQILQNLISNAVKYTPQNGKIRIEAAEADLTALPPQAREALRSGGRYMQICIRDTGVGIKPEELERIFDRFYRTENPLKIEAGGTGLGLALVRPLVRLLNGTILVESIPDEGSTFTVILPVAA